KNHNNDHYWEHLTLKKVSGFEIIDSLKSLAILNAEDIMPGTYIIRPDSKTASYAIDIKGGKGVETFPLRNINSLFFINDEIRANSLKDLILEIKKMVCLPNGSQIKGINLVPYVLIRSMEKSLADEEVKKLPGFQNVNLFKSMELLNGSNIQLGTYIVRPGSEAGTFSMDVRGAKKIHRFKLNEFFSNNETKSKNIVDLIGEIKRKLIIPNTQLPDSGLIPYNPSQRV
nr:hypothetical protein [Parachlamydiaceae bacterium]